MAKIRLQQVAKSYGQTQVLFDIDLDVADGEFVVIVGPSGCGKSSLLRMVAGLEEVSQGEIYIDGRLVNKVEPKDRDIAMVFQNYALYPHMNVFNNMAYGLKLRGLPKQDIQQRVQNTARMLQLENLLKRHPRELSGGQRQRVAMGRAIVREPAVFLFDEPLSNLDAKLRTQMRMEIRKLQQRLNVTSLYVTHDQVEAMTLADRLVVLNNGNIEQVDTPKNIYGNPASVYVAGFIGSPEMNFFSAKIANSGSCVVLDVGGQFNVKANAWSGQPDKAVTIGIRPEKLQPCSSTEADFCCLIDAIETLGAETLVHCTMRPEKNQDVRLVAKLSGSTIVNTGELLYLKLTDQAFHVFDHATGRRLANN